MMSDQNTVLRDAKRYWRLRVLGVALCGSKELRDGNVTRFTNLDAAVDEDIRINPSRGEAELKGGKEGDGESKLPESFDAHDWAKEFTQICASKGITIDEDWMVTWFANAIMAGYDEAGRQNYTREHTRAALATPETSPLFTKKAKYTREQVDAMNLPEKESQEKLRECAE